MAVVSTRPVRRGEVFLVDLDPTRGAEIQKMRPCVVVSPDELNAHLRTVRSPIHAVSSTAPLIRPTDR
jgi:mRNA interferase MazF